MNFKVPLAALLSFALFTACSDGFFKTLMEGKNDSASAGSLKIAPATATIVVNSNLSLQATGGDGNYTFSLVGGSPGAFNSATKVYTAPASAGTATLQVTDGTGASAQAVLYITSTAAPDYRVAISPAPTFPSTGAGGANFTGSFKIENISAQAGVATLNWKVYISRSSQLDTTLDPIASSGTLAALGASSVSSLIPFSGTWPTAASTYYIIIVVSAVDDVSTANNQAISSGIAVTGAAAPAYSITSVSPLATALTQSASSITSQSLIIKNIGVGPGIYPITWAVYLLPKTTIGAQDTAIVSGTTPALNSALTVSVPFPGAVSYPSTPGTYYFVAKVSAFDDTAGTGTKVLASSPIIVSGPLYDVTAISATSGTTAGGAVSGNFTIRNDGNGNGASPVSWSVYASPTATLGAGDSLIASGTIPALTAGASASPTYSGTWPSVAGSYYIIATAQAADDATLGMLASGSPVAVAGPTYTVTAPIPLPTGNTAGGAVSGSFTVKNTGGGTGSSPVSWSVYASLNSTAAVTTGDTLIESGTTPALGPGLSSAPAPSYSGTWPTVAGSYYLKVKVQSSDDAPGGVFASGSPVTVVGPTYSVSGISSSGTAANGSVSGSFTITNTGIGSGSSLVSWSVYASLNTATFGSGATLIESGTTAALASGASSSPVAYTGSWPSVVGSYYIIVRVQAADAATVGTLATNSSVSVVGPTYTVTAVPQPMGSTAAGGTLSGTFTIQNTGGGNGSSSVSWSVFASPSATLGAGATLIVSGTTPALASGASSSPAYSGSWPSVAGSYYIIVRVHAADAAMIGTGVSTSQVTVAGPTYSVSGISWSGTAANSTVSGSFMITNNTGSGTGSSPISWSVFVSSNSTFGVGDILIASNSVTLSSSSTLAAGASSSPTYSGVWPTAGLYYI